MMIISCLCAPVKVTLMGLQHSSEVARIQAAQLGLPQGCQLPWPSAVRFATFIGAVPTGAQPIANVMITHQVTHIHLYVLVCRALSNNCSEKNCGHW